MIEIPYLDRRFPTTIHICLRLDEYYFFASPHSIANKREKGPAGESNSPPMRKQVNDTKTNVVACSLVFRTRIAKTNDDMHGLISGKAGKERNGEKH